MFKPLLPLFLIMLTSTRFVGHEGSIYPTKARLGKDYALFIAVQDYKEWNDLRNPIKDAEAIAKELREEYDFKTKILRNPSRLEIYNALETYRKKTYQEDSQLLIFMTGHGEFREASNEGFFIPKEGKSNDPFGDSYFAHTRLERIVDNIPCNHILLAIDACYSGTFDETIAYKDYGRRPGENQKDEASELIRRLLKNTTRRFMTSGGKERTFDGRDHSPFTKRFLEGLRSYGIDDKVLTFTELTGFMEKANPMPRHGTFGSHDGGGFVFLTKTNHINNKSSAISQEETTWQLTTQQNTPSAYRFYLNAFPSGKYKATAEARLKTPPDNMVFIKGGTFMTGCTAEQDDDCGSNEKPVRQVRLSDYYLGRTEVSRGEFREFIHTTAYQTTADKEGNAFGLKDGKWGAHEGLNWINIGFPQTDEHPVIGVSWYDAVEYCNWKSQQESLNPCYIINSEKITCNWSANGYRLPTEAEWEFAARSRGKGYKYAWGNGSPDGNIRDESYKKEVSSGFIWEGYNDNFVYTSPVGKFEQGDLGLADMTGNVWDWCWDWCWDWYDSEYYENNPQQNPKGADSGSGRVLRGGSWRDIPSNQRVTCLNGSSPSFRYGNIGFRLSRAAW